MSKNEKIKAINYFNTFKFDDINSLKSKEILNYYIELTNDTKENYLKQIELINEILNFAKKYYCLVKIFKPKKINLSCSNSNNGKTFINIRINQYEEDCNIHMFFEFNKIFYYILKNYLNVGNYVNPKLIMDYQKFDLKYLKELQLEETIKSFMRKEECKN